MSWTTALSAVIKAIIPAISNRITQVLAFFLGKRAGRAEQRAAQDEADLKAIDDATRASNRLRHDPASVRDDPYNRDAS